MQILSIGNSFSEDATTYLHDMAKLSGKSITTANLVIGGCSLERHFRNMHSEAQAYSLHFNGEATGFNVSIKEALLSRAWDVVTLQQASHFSAIPDTYTPYIEQLAAYIRALCPKAKFVIHQTWAYEDASARLVNTAKFDSAKAMYEAIVNAYNKAVEITNADGLIPSGDIMYRLSTSGVGSVHRDTFHAAFGVGRYALAMTWLRYLTGADVSDNTFTDTKEPLTEEQIATVKKLVSEIVPLGA